MKEVKVMKIGAGKEVKDGKRMKINGYAPKAGRSLCELLKSEKEVKIVSLGDSPGNNALKAITYAQRLLNNEGKNLEAIEFKFVPVDLVRSDGSQIKGKAVSVHLRLLDK